MNRRPPLAAGEGARAPALSAAGRTTGLRPAGAGGRRRPRPVGRQVEHLGSAGEHPPPVVELAVQPSPASRSRCQRAKSAYWMGSSGRGEGSPAANAR